MGLKTVYQDENILVKKSRKPPGWYLWVRPAANVLPVTRLGKILLMHEYKAWVKRWIWGFPGGIIEPGETAEQAAKRECEEELGIKVSRLRKMVEIKTNFPDTTVTYFLGYGLKKSKAKGWEGEKIGKVKAVTIDELLAMAQAGKIADPRKVSTILQLHHKVKLGKIDLKKQGLI